MKITYLEIFFLIYNVYLLRNTILQQNIWINNIQNNEKSQQDNEGVKRGMIVGKMCFKIDGT